LVVGALILIWFAKPRITAWSERRGQRKREQQRHLAGAVTPLPDHNIEELEGFREEYAAFPRNVQPWAKGIANYLQFRGMKDHPLLWRHAPTNYFEKAKPFGKPKSTPVA